MKLCRYNWHSAGSLGWPFPVLRYKCIYRIKYTEALLSTSTRNLLRFEISKMLIAVLKNILVTSFAIIFGTLSRGQGDTWYQYGVVSSGNGCAAPSNPGVYADVVYFLPWIQQQTGSQYTRLNISALVAYLFITSSLSSFYLPNNTTVRTSTSIQLRRVGQQGPTRTQH